MREALAHADAHRIGVVARPATSHLSAIYRRFGFVPAPSHADVLVRSPAGHVHPHLAANGAANTREGGNEPG